MKAVLVLAHGSRQKETVDTFESIVAMTRERLPGVLVEGAYMEFCEPDVTQGLTRLVEQGADEITVAPYFLFKGVHIHKDIPEPLSAFQKTHPGVRIRMAPILGVDDRLADVLADRIREAL